MDRRQRKLQEKKKKKREAAKKKARAAASRRPDRTQLLVGAAARGPFGPCAVSNGWDDEAEPALVTAVVTRRLPDGDLVAGVALVDRTCLGVKEAFPTDKIADEELDDLLDQVGAVHGGMTRCEPLVAQSIVYHAIDYADRLGFPPARDFPEALFGPRPAELTATPWHAAQRPAYVAGPDDDVVGILERLEAAVGAGGFDFVDLSELDGGEDEDEDKDEDEDGTV